MNCGWAFIVIFWLFYYVHVHMLSLIIIVLLLLSCILANWRGASTAERYTAQSTLEDLPSNSMKLQVMQWLLIAVSIQLYSVSNMQL